MKSRSRSATTQPGEPIAQPFAISGRPRERQPIVWFPLVLRLLGLAWGGAILAALIDSLGQVPHLSFATASVMTAVFVAALFLWTRPRDYIEEDPQRALEEAEDAAQDGLTQLPTFGHFSRRLGEEYARARRMNRRLAVVLIDVNNLTAVNKEYGVRAGDEVLRHVASVINGSRRFNDVVARLGDDEFGVILLDTGEEGVNAFIERLEDRLARESATAEVQGRSISLWAGVCSGSAVASPAHATADAVLDSAIESLDQAKQERERRRRMWLSA